MKNNIFTRAEKILNLSQFEELNKAETFGPVIDAQCPYESQNILRMLIKSPSSDGFQIPEKLEWLNYLISMSNLSQSLNDINQPFCYVTVRHGEVKTKTDDEWHLDGFSMRITHIPEQNYIWVDSDLTTEYVEQSYDIPKDFNPLEYNMNKLLIKQLNESTIKQIEAKKLTVMDPYILHRRPSKTFGKKRTFVRISYTPIEIDDINNTKNPLLKTHYTKDGVAFRNKLKEY